MKRAKIMLTAIVVLGAVGGALAFKAASKFNGTSYCTTPSGVCGTVRYTPNASAALLYCSTQISGDCTIERLRAAVNP